jgi:NADH:ubiquinone oxidoreductase subunit 6 (subunit J)
MVFFVIGAPFIAALEVIVYAGAIMVLFIFTIMLVNVRRQETERFLHRQAGVAILVGIVGLSNSFLKDLL